MSGLTRAPALPRRAHGRSRALGLRRRLGPYGLLLRASSREDLEAFGRRTLRPLIDHDRAHGGDLLHTLRAFLEEDRVQRRAAARCFVHVNTIVYRVRRIEELLAIDLGDPAAVFDITLALRILDLLGETPSRTRAASSAPGAAATRNGPSDHERIATSARSCHARRDVAGWRLDRGTDAAWCKPRRTDPVRRSR